MAEPPICAACGQQHLHIPTRCFSCERPIVIGQAVERDLIHGVCTPRHRDCNEVQPALL